MDNNKKIDITEGLEDLSEEEIKEFSDLLTKTLETTAASTKAKFLASKQEQALRQSYEREQAGLNLAGLSSGQRVKRLSNLKAKYRAMGLQVW